MGHILVLKVSDPDFLPSDCDISAGMTPIVVVSSGNAPLWRCPSAPCTAAMVSGLQWCVGSGKPHFLVREVS